MSIRSASREAIRTLDLVWDGSLPIDPVALADALLYPALGRDLPIRMLGDDLGSDSGYSELVAGEDPHFLCAYNLAESPERQRFTQAHELGHVVLGHVTEAAPKRRDPDFRNDRTSPEYPMERDANAFAATLLMPSRTVRELADQGMSLWDMAAALGVSVPAMSYRLQNLGIVDL